MTPLTVLTNLPDLESARKLAKVLVEKGLVACVNIMSPVQSIYRWKGAIEEAAEVPLFLKTTQDRYAEVEKTIGELHPYEIPEIIALPIIDGLPAYLSWVKEETTLIDASVS